MNKSDLFKFDKEKIASFNYLIGTDEAGRGPGAGPVYSAAVCFTKIDNELKKQLLKVNDSKQLSEQVREELFDVVKGCSVYSIASSSVEEIEKLNILNASLLSMKRACDDVLAQLKTSNAKILVDGNKLVPDKSYNQEFVIKGDSKSLSIAAASILAKVSRDRFMNQLAKEFPQYVWEKNKGYLTPDHLAAIDEFGTTKWHRKKFLEKHFEKATQLSLL